MIARVVVEVDWPPFKGDLKYFHLDDHLRRRWLCLCRNVINYWIKIFLRRSYFLRVCKSLTWTIISAIFKRSMNFFSLSRLSFLNIFLHTHTPSVLSSFDSRNSFEQFIDTREFRALKEVIKFMRIHIPRNSLRQARKWHFVISFHTSLPFLSPLCKEYKNNGSIHSRFIFY